MYPGEEIYENTKVMFQNRLDQQQSRPRCVGQENQENEYEIENKDPQYLAPETGQNAAQDEYEPLDVGITYDDVRNHPATIQSMPKPAKERKNPRSKDPEQIEMQNFNKVRKDDNRKQRNGITYKNRILYLMPLTLIIAVAALIISIFMVVGVFKKSECACLDEIRNLTIQIAYLKNQHFAPSFASSPSAEKMSPTPASVFPRETLRTSFVSLTPKDRTTTGQISSSAMTLTTSPQSSMSLTSSIYSNSTGR